MEVIRRIKEVCGEDYPVSLRYSVTSKTIDFNVGAVPGETFTEAGRTMEESEKAIRHLCAAGVDLFSCDNGTYDACAFHDQRKMAAQESKGFFCGDAAFR